MKRGGYIKRRTPLVARRTLKRTRMVRRPTRLRPGADPEYLALVRLLPCVASRMSACEGTAVDAHHAGTRPGVAMKAPDSTVIPLCRHHHGRLHDGAHPFRDWTKARRREWQDEQIRRTQEELSAPPFDADVDRADEAAESWTVSEVQVDA